MEELTTHEKKEQKKQEKEQTEKQKHDAVINKKTKGKAIKYGITALVILLIILGVYYFVIKPIKSFKPYYSGLYHWHTNFEISVCGKPVEIKCPGSICGPMNLHHHNDNIIHMEGNSIAKKEDLAIGNFFDNVNIKFSETELLDKKNGDLCNDKPGTVKIYINGKQNYEYRNFVLEKCDAQAVPDIRQRCDKIELKFE